MSELITTREAQQLAKIGSTAFYMAKRFNPKEFPKERVMHCGKNHTPKIFYDKKEIINFFTVKYPNFSN
ncbi:hypothetical protein P3M90_004124 [Salmonella enterica]|uniref:DNA-binding protein n=3 Tax=Salmonella houtenae TaxID=59205 RepID=A0A702LXF2_SALHO|nr:hypothetical protein [Salmonella enterica subsp. houtenae]EAB2655372.1 hypothetical protein [Salmonella enterica]ECH8282221.1 hypothetical protein [Salmonella enterica subsp. enterica]EEH1861323.1 hypothetical protein [Salmonella enterica subsp. houtenae serovar 50:g,z51:-]ESE88630.1 hypothetical protein SEH50133_12301 [Salmonella enterica subsp. houtenae serovar 50:g,z51:- str. 01-0133]HAC6521032.1 hypothetical protein [Salmonella enterica subsp. houtenae serovar 45:g,z51:-]HAE7577907.1 h